MADLGIQNANPSQDWSTGWTYGYTHADQRPETGFSSLPYNVDWNSGAEAGWSAYRAALSSNIGPTGEPLTQQTSPTTNTSGEVLGTGTESTGSTYTGPSPDDQLINSIFDPTFNYLNQAQSQITAQQPGVEQDIQNQYNTSLGSLQGEKGIATRGLEASGQQAGSRKEDAASAARRLYQELVSGGRQRFGGATSAGQAYGELTANQLQRNQGDIQKQYGEAMQKIDGYKQDLEVKFTSALAELENQKNTAINEAKRFFQDKLLEISRLRGEAESNKSMQRLQALTDLRNTVMSINMQDYQYKQQLAANKQGSEQQVEQARQTLLQQVQGGQQATSNFQANASVAPNDYNRLAMSAPAGGSLTSFTGQINRKQEEPVGALRPIRYDENFA